jgi:hypothetical protein
MYCVPVIHTQGEGKISARSPKNEENFTKKIILKFILFHLASVATPDSALIFWMP